MGYTQRKHRLCYNPMNFFDRKLGSVFLSCAIIIVGRGCGEKHDQFPVRPWVPGLARDPEDINRVDV